MKKTAARQQTAPPRPTECVYLESLSSEVEFKLLPNVSAVARTNVRGVRCAAAAAVAVGTDASLTMARNSTCMCLLPAHSGRCRRRRPAWISVLVFSKEGLRQSPLQRAGLPCSQLTGRRHGSAEMMMMMMMLQSRAPAFSRSEGLCPSAVLCKHHRAEHQRGFDVTTSKRSL